MSNVYGQKSNYRRELLLNSNPMRLFYTVFFLLLTAPIFSQQLQFAPIQGNPILRSYSAQKTSENAEFVERLTGVDPRNELDNRNLVECPPPIPLGFNIVVSGTETMFEVDTFGFGKSGEPGFLNLVGGPGFNFGQVTLPDSTINFAYTADAGLSGINSDTILIEFEEPGNTDTILLIMTVIRAGKTIIADPITIDPSEVIQYCLDNELGFPAPMSCTQFADCPDGYDGDGGRNVHFRSYSFPDTCIVYYANRFPGTDTVCVEICDEMTVCDLFKIPITVRGDTLKISQANPFFDDFSNTDGRLPSPDFWLDDDVFLNSTLAKNPPSVGFVTFDGLDEGGTPYDLINGGVGDILTSKAIDLSSFNAGDDVFLRFFFAPKGYGQGPEIEDIFNVEFRNNQREWVEMTSFEGVDTLLLSDVPDFNFVAIHLDDPSFFHGAFQFRFKARTSPGGYGDWWHLDYVHLGNGSTDVNNFPDFSFATQPTSFLKNYTSLPLQHLKADLDGEIKKGTSEIMEVSITNRRNDESNNFASSSILFEETTQSTSLSTSFTIVDANESLTEPLNHKDLQNSIPDGNRQALISGINNLPDVDFLNIEGEFSFTPNTSETGSIYEINNSVKSNTVLSDYFAHDDGSAELQFFVQFAQGGENVAVKYHANVEDTLKGVQFMFPHFTTEDFESQLFNLQVWIGELDEEPDYERELLRPFYPDEVYDTLQGFTSYRLEDFFGELTPVVIPANTDFYVGWQQLTSAEQGIPVGFDLTTSCDCNYANLTGNWVPFPTNNFDGSLMVRPVFGNVPFNTTSAVGEVGNEFRWLDVYPNPTSVLLHVDLKTGLHNDYKYVIFNQLGQLVLQGDLEKTISVELLDSGHYFLQTLDKKSGETLMSKFVVSKK